MHIWPKIPIVVVVLQAGRSLGDRKARATVNRANEIRLTVATLRTILFTSATQQQLTLLKRYTPRCAKKSISALLSIFMGDLGPYLAIITGRRRRDAVNVQEQSPVSAPIDASKEPATATQDINTIMAQATILLKKLPNDRLVLTRQLVQALSGNLLLRGPFVAVVVNAASAC